MRKPTVRPIRTRQEYEVALERLHEIERSESTEELTGEAETRRTLNEAYRPDHGPGGRHPLPGKEINLMKFIVDQCAGRRIAQWLTREGHDVTEVRTMMPDPGDQAILEIARRERRVLITRDKGFGKMVHRDLVQHSGIVQIPNVSVERRIEMIGDILQNHHNDLRDHALMTVDWGGRIRVDNETEKEEPRSKLGKEIKSGRERAELKQHELATRLGISNQYLNDIEHGRRRTLRGRLIRQLAQELDIDQDTLWFRAGRIPPDLLNAGPGPEEIIRAMRALRKALIAKG